MKIIADKAAPGFIEFKGQGESLEAAKIALLGDVDEFMNINCIDNAQYDEALGAIAEMGIIDWLLADGFKIRIIER